METLWQRRPRFLGGLGHIEHLWLRRPKWLFRGMHLLSIPAVPFEVLHLTPTVLGLLKRQKEFKPAITGLSNTYTIGGISDRGHDFLFPGSLSNLLDETVEDEKHEGEMALTKLADILKGNPGRLVRYRNTQIHTAEGDDDDRSHHRDLPKTALTLDDPEQWTISWTNYRGVYRDALPLSEHMAETLTDVEAANKGFWPTIAEHGLAYNLLILQKARSANISALKEQHIGGWTDTLDAAYEAGSLFVIDLSVFQHVKPHKADGFDRFTPSTTIYLEQDRSTKALTPISIRVSRHDGPSTYFVPSDPAWLYAVQAAKVSVTVWGIWLGHVYHWHIVTAAMQMTMYNTFSADHPVYQLMQPQSQHLMGFDAVLLLAWKTIGPPTSITNPRRYLRLSDRFAQGRNFFDDDPKATLLRFGITEEDFTVDTPWDRFPTAGRLLRIWDMTEAYITVFVDETYSDDAAVLSDRFLQSWMRSSAKKRKGNIRGLPALNSRAALKAVLTSLIYRLTAHGATRLNPSLNPVETFVANYPPCLQKTDIPSPDAHISTEELLAYLPKTGVIGKMVRFYYVFVFSSPYEPFIPEGGEGENLFFPGGIEEPRNAALVAFRESIVEFINDYEPEQPQRHQWPLSIET